MDCHCKDVAYAPVCSSDGKMTFFSACEAGCRSHQDIDLGNGRRIRKFSECGCVAEYSRSTGSYTPAKPWWGRPDSQPPTPVSLARWHPTPTRTTYHSYNSPLDSAVSG